MWLGDNLSRYSFSLRTQTYFQLKFPGQKLTCETRARENRLLSQANIQMAICLYSWTSHKWTPLVPEKVSAYITRDVCLWEVRNVVFVCIAGNTTKCPFTRGVCLWEMSVSRGSTVYIHVCKYYLFRVNKERIYITIHVHVSRCSLIKWHS